MFGPAHLGAVGGDSMSTTDFIAATYTLDADVEDGEVQRLYSSKGGWVDFDSSEIDSDGNGSGTDENGRHREFRGLAAGSIESDDEESDETEESKKEDPLT
jgi:hypothetical protein